MAFSEYHQLRALIIDDFKQFLDTIRRMLEEMQIPNIDMVPTSGDALKLCENRVYDIILCDYNLGEGKRNGFQLLETLRKNGITKGKTVFVMITAEAGKDMVMATYDIEPDAYLTKPFNYKTLKLRLDKLLAQRKAIKPLYDLLEENNTEGAISLCEQEAASQNRYSSEYSKILGDLYLKTSQYSKAETLLKTVLDKRPLDWAMVEFAQVKVAKGEYQAAIDCLEKVITKNKYCLEAYDLLAKAYEAIGEPDRSFQVLVDVTEISPLSIIRQRNLGAVAETNYEINVAAKAYLQCIQLGEFSCHDQPENYMNLGRTAATLIEEQNSDADELSKKALKALDLVSERFKENMERDTQNFLIQSQIYAEKKENQKSNEMLEHAESVLKEYPDNFSVQTKLDWVQALSRNGQKERSEELLKNLVKEYKNDEDALLLIDRFLDEPQSKANRNRVAAINKKGISFYKDKNYKESINLFKRSSRLFPKHIGIHLNLIQALISEQKENNANENHRELCTTTLQSIGERISTTDKQYARYQSLRNQAKELEPT